jgi:two-component system cell cycle response regulator
MPPPAATPSGTGPRLDSGGAGYCTGMRVVLAHADAQTRAELAAPLARVGHDVTEAATADEAVAACRGRDTDVAVVAVDLCRADGESLLAAIKGDAEAFRTAVVLLGRADLDLDAAILALQRGVQDFLVEPVSHGELVTRVTAAGRMKVLQEELAEQTRRLETLIFEDALTGLANRRYILTQLGALVSGARRHGRPVSAAVIDVDHFKSVNDRYGHAVGDRVLVAVAAALRGHLRAEDHLGRLGGEEFLALLPDTDAGAAARVTEKLCREVGQTLIEHDGEPLRVTISIGMATWDGELPDEMLHRADVALYAAKAAGRDRAVAAPATVSRRT